jgi:hypothetical protein
MLRVFYINCCDFWVLYHSYPKLNHLFLEGEGKPNPKEYDIPGHVPQMVINDIAKFIFR